MRRLLFTFALVSIGYYHAMCQVNVQLLHQLVAENKSEHERQAIARDRQSVTTANEVVNRTQMEKLKVRYRELKNRFHTVGLAIDAAQISIEASPIVSEILRQHEIVYRLAADNPLLITLALQTEIDLAERASMLARYIAGIALSIGDVNQMKASDRKLLFGHALTELRRIEGASRGLARALSQTGRKKASNPFANYIDQDRRMVEEIIRNVNILKN